LLRLLAGLFFSRKNRGDGSSETYIELHSITPLKMGLFIGTAVTTRNPLFSAFLNPHAGTVNLDVPPQKNRIP
jgi:hypothetical protein